MHRPRWFTPCITDRLTRRSTHRLTQLLAASIAAPALILPIAEPAFSQIYRYRTEPDRRDIEDSTLIQSVIINPQIQDSTLINPVIVEPRSPRSTIYRDSDRDGIYRREVYRSYPDRTGSYRRDRSYRSLPPASSNPSCVDFASMRLACQ